MVSRVLTCTLTWLLAVGSAEAAEPVLHMTVQPYNEEGISTAVGYYKGMQCALFPAVFIN